MKKFVTNNNGKTTHKTRNQQIKMEKQTQNSRKSTRLHRYLMYALMLTGICGSVLAQMFDIAEVSQRQTTGVTLRIRLSEAGTVYWVVVADGAMEPSDTEIIARQGNGGSTPINSGSIPARNMRNESIMINGLNVNTSYDVYLVGVPNRSAASSTMVRKLDISTLPLPTITITDLGAISDGFLNATEDDAALVVSGRANNIPENQRVTLELNSAMYQSTNVVNQSRSAWTVRIPATNLRMLSNGTRYTITAHVSNGRGTSATPMTRQFTYDATPPTVTAGNISITTVGSGTGAFIVGDDVTVEWDNTSSGDNTSGDNGDIASVAVDFSEFGGGSVAASESSDTWTATYTIVAGTINGGANRNVFVTARDNANNETRTEDDANARVDNSPPTLVFNPAPPIDGIIGDGYLNATEDDDEITISGEVTGAESGRVVMLTLNGMNGKSYNAARGGGAGTDPTIWQATIPAADLQMLTNGSMYTITANVSDAAGNAATEISSGSFTYDTIPPTNLSFDPTSITLIDDGYLNATEDNDDLAITGSVSDAENDRPVTLTLRSIGGTYSRDYLSSGTGGSNVNATGNWRVTIPADSLQALTNDSTYTILANVSDTAKNAATQAEIRNSFIYDPEPPTITIERTDGLSRPTNRNPIRFDVTLSEVIPFGEDDMFDLTNGDFTLTSSPVQTLTPQLSARSEVTPPNPRLPRLSVTVRGTGMPPPMPTMNSDVTVSVGMGAFTDLAGNLNTASTPITVTFDPVLPTFPVMPTISDSTVVGFNINTQLSEGGTVYWVVVPDGGTTAIPLPAAQVKAGTGTGGVAGAIVSGTIDVDTRDVERTATVSSLPTRDMDRQYDVYLVAEDSATNESIVIKLDAATLATDDTSDARIIPDTEQTSGIDHGTSSKQVDNIMSNTDGSRLTSIEITDAGTRDNSPTIIDSITLTVTNHQYLRRLALYNGPVEVADTTVTSGTVIFPGINFSVADGMRDTLNVYASFEEMVEDNVNIQVTLSDVTVDTVGSSLLVTNITGGSSDSTGTNNQIQVTATTYDFVVQPTDVNQCVVMSPAVQVEAVDQFDNRDLDYTGTASITSDGALQGSSVAITFANGIGTAGAIEHRPATAFTMTGETRTLTVSDDASGAGALTEIMGSFTLLPVNQNSDAQIVPGGETANIDYAANQQDNLTSTTGVSLASIEITDPASGNDDGNPTILTELTMTVTNASYLRQLALYDGTTELAEIAVSGGTANFTGMNLEVSNRSTTTLTLRGSFTTTPVADRVTDNTPVSFTLTGATAATSCSSRFGTITGGTSSTTSPANQIEVEARVIVYPTGMNPGSETYQRLDATTDLDNITFTVEAQDDNGILDEDQTSTLTISGGSNSTAFDNANIEGGTDLTLVGGVGTKTIQIANEHDNMQLSVSGNSSTIMGATLRPAVAMNINIYDTIAPTLTSMSTPRFPADDAMGVSISDINTMGLQLTFSEEVAVNTSGGDIIIVGETTVPPENIALDVTSAAIEIDPSDRREVTLRLPRFLSSGVGYYVIIPNNVFMDSLNNNAGIGTAGFNNFLGYADPADWNWTMETILTIANATYNTTSNVATLEFSDDIRINGNSATVASYFNFRDGRGNMITPMVTPTIGTVVNNRLPITIDLGDDPTDQNEPSGAQAGVLGDVIITYTDTDDTDGINISTTATPAVQLLNIDADDGPTLDLDNTPPTITGAARVMSGVTLSDTEITVTFSEPVQAPSSTIVATDFTVTDGQGTAFAVNTWADGTARDNDIALTVADFSGAIGDLTVTYTSSTSVIEDFGGNSTASGQSAVIDFDPDPPTFDSLTVINMNTIAMHFSEEVQIQDPNTNLRDFTVSDMMSTTYSVFTKRANEDSVVLTTADLSSAEGTLSVTYTNNSNEIRDYGENPVATTTRSRDLPGTPRLMKILPSMSSTPPPPSTSPIYANGDDLSVNGTVALFRTDGMGMMERNPSVYETVTIIPTIDQSTIRIYSDPSLPQGDPDLYWEMDDVSTSGEDVTVANILSSFASGTSPIDFSGTDDNGIYTFYITEQTDIAAHGVAREGAATTYSLAFLDDITRTIDGPTPNDATTFSEDQEDIEVDISLFHPAGQTLAFTGERLQGSVNNPSRGTTSGNKFVVGADGTTGSNQTSITWTNAAGVRATFTPPELAFNITSRVDVFVPISSTNTASQDRRNRSFARSDATTPTLNLNEVLTGFDRNGAETSNEDFYTIEAYFIRNGIPVTMGSDGMDVGVAGVAFPTGGNIASDILIYDSPSSAGMEDRPDIDALNDVSNTVSTFIKDEWEIDPDGLPANIPGLFTNYNTRIDTIRLFTIWRNDESTPTYGQISSADIYLYPDPVIRITLQQLGMDNFYCEDEFLTRNVRAAISNYLGDIPGDIPGVSDNIRIIDDNNNNNNIQNGYLLEYSADGNTPFIATAQVNFSNEEINRVSALTRVPAAPTAPAVAFTRSAFSLTDPLGDGSNARGFFRIIYNSEPLTDAEIIVQAVSPVFEVRPKVSAPRLDLTALGNYGGFNDSDSSYVFEFCEGDMVPNIAINTTRRRADAVGSNLNAAYNWYRGDGTLVTPLGTNSLDPTLLDLFPTMIAPGITDQEDIFVTRTVNGCESDTLKVSFRVFAIPDEVEISAPDTNPNIHSSGGEYYFEYCWNPTGADVAYDILEITSDLEDPLNSPDGRAFIENRSYFAIWDSESAADPIATIIWNNMNDYEITDLSSAPYNAPVSGTSAIPNAISPEAFWISEIVADSTILNSAAVFEGCEGERTRINAIIYNDPEIPRDFTGNPRDNDGSPDIFTYYMCANEAFPDVGIDPPAGLVNDYTFQWSNSDTFTDTLTIGNRRGEVVTQDDLRRTGNPGGFDESTPGIYTYYVRIVTNRNLNSGYLGCESAPQRVDIVVYPTSSVPTISVNNVADRESDGGSQLESTNSTSIGNFDVEYNFCVDGGTDAIVGGLDAGTLFRSTINFRQNVPVPRAGSPDEDNEVLWFAATPDADGLENDNAVASTVGLTVDTLSATALQMDGIENGTFNFAVVHRENFIDGYTFFDGCFSSVEDNTVYVRVNVNTVPVPQFTWTGITEDQPTVFNFIDQTSVGTPVNYDFKVYSVNADGTRGAEVVSNSSTTAVDLNASRSEFTATFADAGVYEAELEINSLAGCNAVEVRRFRILEHIDFPTLNIRSYQQFFETGDGGWFAEFQGDDGLIGSYEVTSPRVSTWVHGTPDGAIINGTSDGSGQAWSTTATYDPASTIENTYVGGEDSWVYSPSFDFSNITNPAIQFETYRDLELKDGVTFQYSTDNGTNWITLGEFEPTLDGTSPSSGTNWFNARQISSSVGQAAVVNETPENVNREGWSGQYDADERAASTNGWLVSTHELVRISDPTNVRFRFALSSQGTPEEAKLGNGFGFDNMRIFNLEKSVLVEQFSSSIDNNAIRLDTTAQLFARGRLYINYFTSLSNTEDRIDLLNMRNPSGPAQRRLYYGIGDLGTSALDGEVIAKASSTSPGWSDVDVSIKELEIPELLLLASDDSFGLVANDSEPNIISVSATWRFQVSGDDGDEITLEDQDYSFYFAVIEEAISVTSTTTEGGENNYADLGIDSIYNVFRTFMPNADGDPFTNYRGSVATNQEFNVDAEWEISSVFDVNKLRVIAFAQNNNTQTIIQSGELDITGKASLVTGLEEEPSGFELYPNPANNGFTVEFAAPTTAKAAWVLLDQTGRETVSGEISAGSRHTSVSTKDVPSGLYFIHIYGGDGKPQFKRVIVVH